jgi:excisionase family DNA binding protein
MSPSRDYKIRAPHDHALHNTAGIAVSENTRDSEAANPGRTAVAGGELNSKCVQPAAYTIAEFCEAFRVSRGTFYNLQRKGEAPRVFRLGKRVLILSEAVADWIRRNEALAAIQSTQGANH